MTKAIVRQMKWDEEEGRVKTIVIEDEENSCQHIYEQPEGWENNSVGWKRRWWESQKKDLEMKIKSNRRWRGLVIENRQERYELCQSKKERDARRQELLDFHTAQKEEERQGERVGNIFGVVVVFAFFVLVGCLIVVIPAVIQATP